ncbi:MAG: radical SAM protein [Burkholderiaceae bacterium]|nr:radical SAM protein [Burkholderiaceae bacterium]
MQAIDLENSSREPATVCRRVELQLLTTLQCNLNCSYCSLGVGKVLRSQKSASYTIDQLETFVRTHLADREIYITLYGGEPALNIKLALGLVERFPLARFNMQTNGTLLHRVPDAVLARLSNVMISVDGGQRVTDGFRGKGVYRKVLDNLEKIRGRTDASFCARMTWWSGETSADEIDELARTFDYVYFQFAQDEGAHTPESVAAKKAVLGDLVARFFAAPELYPIVPIMGTVRNKLLPARVEQLSNGLSQCRASTNLINVMPDGRVFPCPDMMYEPELQQGDVVANWLRRSTLQPHPDMPCTQCRAQPYCRGNCMKNLYLAYVRKDARWRESVTEPVCELIRHLGDEVERHDPRGWYAGAPVRVRRRLADAEIYEFCEVMP